MNPETDRYDEDMFYWPLQVQGESISNSCSMMTGWTGTDIYWKANADRCKRPNFMPLEDRWQRPARLNERARPFVEIGVLPPKRSREPFRGDL